MENLTQEDKDFLNQNHELTMNVPIKLIEVESKIDAISEMIIHFSESLNIKYTDSDGNEVSPKDTFDELFKNNFINNIKKSKKE